MSMNDIQPFSRIYPSFMKRHTNLFGMKLSFHNIGRCIRSPCHLPDNQTLAMGLRRSPLPGYNIQPNARVNHWYPLCNDHCLSGLEGDQPWHSVWTGRRLSFGGDDGGRGVWSLAMQCIELVSSWSLCSGTFIQISTWSSKNYMIISLITPGLWRGTSFYCEHIIVSRWIVLISTALLLH